MTAEEMREQGHPTGWYTRPSPRRAPDVWTGLRTQRSQAQARHQTVLTSVMLIGNHYMESLILAQGERWRRA